MWESGINNILEMPIFGYNKIGLTDESTIHKLVVVKILLYEQ